MALLRNIYPILISFIVMVAIGCDRGVLPSQPAKELDPSSTLVQLKGAIDCPRLVLDTNGFSLTFCATTVLKYLDSSYLKEDSLLRIEIERDLAKGNVNANTYSERSRERLIYCFASLLETGDCLIVETISNSRIASILSGNWGEKSAPLSGCGGRIFYTSDQRVILKTLDWIS